MSLVAAAEKQLAQFEYNFAEFAKDYPESVSDFINNNQLKSSQEFFVANSMLLAKVSQQIEQTIPGMMTLLAHNSYPGYFKSLPAIAVADIVTQQQEPLLIPKGTRVRYQNTDWQLAIDYVYQPIQLTTDVNDDQWVLNLQSRLPVSQWRLEQLFFFLNLPEEKAKIVWFYLLHQLEKITLRTSNGFEITLPTNLMPAFRYQSFYGEDANFFQKSREVIHASQSQRFFCFENLNVESVTDDKNFSLVLHFKKRPDYFHELTQQSFSLHSVPLINTACLDVEPILLNHSKKSYPLVLDHEGQQSKKICEILSVHLTDLRSQQNFPCEKFSPETQRGYLSLNDGDKKHVLVKGFSAEENYVLSAKVYACDGVNMPEKFAATGLLPDYPQIKLTNLTKPSKYISEPGDEKSWPLLAHFGKPLNKENLVNLLSLLLPDNSRCFIYQQVITHCEYEKNNELVNGCFQQRSVFVITMGNEFIKQPWDFHDFGEIVFSYLQQLHAFSERIHLRLTHPELTLQWS